jgi:hypothetical protein
MPAGARGLGERSSFDRACSSSALSSFTIGSRHTSSVRIRGFEMASWVISPIGECTTYSLAEQALEKQPLPSGQGMR